MQVVPQGPPPPMVLGPSGLRNPLVILFATVAVAVMAHGFVSFVAALIAVSCFVALARTSFRDVTGATIALALGLMLFAGSVIGLGANSDVDDDDYGGNDYGAYDGPSSGVSQAAQDPANPLADAATADADRTGADAPPETPPGSAAGAALGDLYSVPLSAPRVSDPGDPPSPGGPGRLVSADAADRLPVLENADEASRVLAYYYPLQPPATPDTAVLWLLVAPDGHVTSGGKQLISSTRSEAAQAAIATAPFLRYRPATQGGSPVDVWITQRMVIVP
jgi:hypothetical protein